MRGEASEASNGTSEARTEREYASPTNPITPMLGAAAIIYNYFWLAITIIIAIIAIVSIIASTTAVATTEIKTAHLVKCP